MNQQPIYSNTQPRVVVIGGGTGLSTMLRGLKSQTRNLTAIVTVADDGGGSGVLRDELGMPPPGDIRNCLQALANTEQTMADLLAYRFPEGRLKGQSFGNLFLAALNGMSHSFDEAVAKMSEVLAITGRVLPVTNEDVRLIAEFDDGCVVPGESHIADYKRGRECNIRRVRMEPELPEALPESLEAIRQADMIVLGPGSLYTSVIPNLLVKGVAQAVAESDAVRVYVLNIMTQDGETERYTASDHVRALQLHGSRRLFDFCLANDAPIPGDIRAKYAAEGASPTVLDIQEVERLGVRLLTAPVADWSTGRVRHDPQRLARELMALYREKSPTRIYG
jgi:uncharacterized cofD-like protein